MKENLLFTISTIINGLITKLKVEDLQNSSFVSEECLKLDIKYQEYHIHCEASFHHLDMPWKLNCWISENEINTGTYESIQPSLTYSLNPIILNSRSKLLNLAQAIVSDTIVTLES